MLFTKATEKWFEFQASQYRTRPDSFRFELSQVIRSMSIGYTV
jgi:hypothetical protein